MKKYVLILTTILCLLPTASYGTNDLKALVASMSPDSWASISPTGLDSTTLLQTASATGNIVGDASNGCWDNVRERWYFVAEGHTGTPTTTDGVRTVAYDAPTNALVRLADPPFGAAGDTVINHEWGFTGCDDIGRVIYRTENGFLKVHRFNMATETWLSDIAAPSSLVAANIPFRGLAWDPDLGTAGKLVVVGIESTNQGDIYGWDPTLGTGSGAWARISASLITPGWLSNQTSYSRANYSHKKHVLLFGGDTVDNWVLHADASITHGVNLPCVANENRAGLIHEDPSSGDFVLLCSGTHGLNSWHTYNPDTDVWTTKADPTTIPDHIHNYVTGDEGLFGPAFPVIGIPITNYGGVMYVKCRMGSDCAFRVYKGTGFADFATRCAAAGIIRCIGLDSTADIQPFDNLGGGAYRNYGLIGAAAGTDYTHATIDTTIKASGSGSMKFTIPANSAAEAAGQWYANFSSDYSVLMGENSDTYAQVRVRFSPEYLTNNWAGGEGWKVFGLGQGDINSTSFQFTCTPTDIVLVDNFYRGLTNHEQSCTGSTTRGSYIPFETAIGGDIDIQPGRTTPGCLYSQLMGSMQFPPTGNCFGYFANEFMTFQEHVHLGPRGLEPYLAFSAASIPYDTLNYSLGTIGGTAITAGSLTSFPVSKADCSAPTRPSCVIIYHTAGSSALSQTLSIATATAGGNEVVTYLTTDSSGAATSSTTQPGYQPSDEFHDSYVDLWIGRAGLSSELAVHYGPFQYTAGIPSDNGQLAKIWLLTYDTGRNATGYPVAYAWYDEVALSTTRIADPSDVTSPCTPDHLAFTSQPSNAVLGASLGTVTVHVKDSGGNDCSSDTSTITLSAHSGSTAATLQSGTSLSKSASGGIATWTDLFVSPTAGSISIDANDGVLTLGTSSSATISSGSSTNSGRGRGQLRKR
jgi:hypothetical protein